MSTNLQVHVTTFTNSNSKLNKTISYKNGKLQKKSNGQFAKGTAITQKIPFQKLKDHIDNLKSNQAIASGTIKYRNSRLIDKRVQVITQELLKSQQNSEKGMPIIARTKEHLVFPEQEPGLMLFDIDKRADQLPQTSEEILEQLINIDPRLKNCATLIINSSSSYIYDSNGKELVAAGGLHIYIVMSDASLISAYGKWFEVQAWLKGYGYILISASGSQLARTIVDTSVFGSERLIFEAAPKLEDGLKQNKPDAVFTDGVALSVTAEELVITEEDQRRFEELVAEAKAATKEQADKVKERYIEKRVGQAIKENPQLSPATVKADLIKSMQSRELVGSFYLKRDDGETVTVDEILANPKQYHLKTFYDPFEPEEGRNKAKLYANQNGSVILHSQLHGGQDYILKHAKNTGNTVTPAKKQTKKANAVANAFELIHETTDEFESGLYFKQTDKETDSIELVRIGAPMTVAAMIIDEQTQMYKVRLQFPALLMTNQKTIDLPGGVLEGTKLFERLRDEGYEFSSQKALKQQLRVYIIDGQKLTNNKLFEVMKVGWANGNRSYVFPTKTIGDSSYFFSQNISNNNPYTSSGTLQGWIDQVARLCVDNSNLIVAVSAAFAAPLLRIFNRNNGGLHFYGDSSTGKTTALTIAASVFGHPDEIKMSWRTTDNGLEANSKMFNDNLLLLDEISESKPGDTAKNVYMLGNGQGKARMTKDGTAQAKTNFRLISLSTGEKSIIELSNERDEVVNAGQEVRLVNLPVEQKHGIFDVLHDANDGAAMAENIKNAALAHHGVVGKKWIEVILEDLQREESELKEMLTLVTDDLKDTIEVNAQENRVLNFFALLITAGEYATENDLTGWEPGSVYNAVIRVFDRWKNSNGMRGNTSWEDAKIIEDVTNFIMQHEHSRFAPMDNRQASKAIYNCVGRIKVNKRTQQAEYLFTEIGLVEATGHRSISKVRKVLQKAKMLIGDRGGFTKTHTIDGGVKKRFYTITLPSENAKSISIDYLF